MTRLTMLMAGSMLAATAAVQAQQIGYIEDFALAQDRQEALKQLIPGSEDYYYFHCLQLQNTEQFDQVEALLRAWIKRYKQTPRVVEIQNRQALLTYAQNPAESLEQIRRRLNIRFNHQRETVGQKPNLPTQLDPARISREQLTQRAMARHQNLAGFEPTALDWLVRAELNPVRRRHLLELLQRPDHANLPDLIVADLKHRDSKPFGALAIHRQLLRDQLDACLELKPDLLNQQNFVHIYLSKLRPNADLDWRHDPAERGAYLDRLWGFVEPLAPVHNSLKAHVLYRRLHHDRAQGVYDKQRFMTYIRLPRNVGYIEPRFMQLEQNRRYPANLQADFRAVTLLPIVGSDEELVRSYLQHYFIEEMATDPYQPYINDVFLRHQLAEAKIVNGLGEPEQWYSLLPPAMYQALKERIDIAFAHTNRPHFAAGEEVSLDLYVKNVRTLIVKVFQVNAQNYYHEHHREVNTDINLDGLVANDEFSFAYIEPPLRRVRRHFAFPKLQQRGVYVIDFIGNGMSSRVVVRKGKLRHLVGATLAGHRFTVLNEANAIVKDARISLAGRTFTAGDDGRILVPYSTAPARQPIVISDGTFSSLDSFQHAAEDYRLAAGMFVDRESLLNRRTSQLVVRPALYLNGTPVSLSALKEVILTITSKDHQGVLSSQRIKEFKLYEDRESLHTFQTPPRLSQITFQLQAKVPSRSQNKQIDLAVTETFGLNQIDQSDKVEDLHFANIDGEYFLELLGKTGEPRPDRPVQLAIKHRDFRQPVNLALQTDLAGRVELGPLTDIVSVTATGPEKTAHTWNLPLDRHSYHASLHGVAGEAIELPYLGRAEQPSRSEFSLLEMRGETYVADRFDALSIEDGMLRIEELPRGDYQLLLKHSGQPVRIRLTAGVARAGYALGANRHLEQRGVRPLQIVDIDRGREKIRVRLRNASKFARVHVFATRYQPAFSAFAKLGRIVDPEPLRRSVAQTSSLYVAGRNIGDEYRYIIDRRYANKYPGVMIERPSLLLNAWPLRSTQTKQQTAEEGTKFAPQAEEPKEQEQRDAESQKRTQAGGDFANLDFLSESSALLLNLAPNKRGVVVIPNEAVGAHQHLHVVAVDPQSTAYRSVSLSETPTDFLDLRLAKGLDPERHFTQQKQISVVERGDTFVLADIATSKLKSYDSLASVYSLYATLTGDAHLLQFGFVLNWPNLEPDERRTLYSKHSCHELNFYLYQKDPEFFETVVRPFIANKKDKTFLDDWLLGADLEDYLRPWNYTQLNAVERILLSQHLDDDRPHTVRDVDDRFDLVPPDMTRLDFLFQTALKGSNLEVGESLALDGAKRARFRGGEAAPAVDLRAPRGNRLPGGGGGRSASAATPAAPKGRASGNRPSREKENEQLEDAQEANSLSTRRRRADTKALDRLSRRSLKRKSADKNADRFYAESDLQLGAELRQLYTKLDKTQEWVENNYYRLTIEQQNAQLITVNAFWRDYAHHQPDRPFHSTHLAEAAGNFSEMMFALALLDLPLAADEHESQLADGRMSLTAGSPMVVFHQEIRATEDRADLNSILVSQNYFRRDDRYRLENNQRLDKFVTDEFLVHTVYGCQVVVTNPTSSPKKLDLLLQIPVGAIGVLNTQVTDSAHIDLKPFHTQTIEYHFYFPAVGEYPHYPVHVATNEQLLAHAEPTTLNVVEQLSRIDRASWAYVSQNGGNRDVIDYLTRHNLHRTDLDKIAFRMRDKPFFLSVVDLLEARHAYNHTLWSYGIAHNEPRIVREYLQHADAFVAQCGSALESPLLTINPVARKSYQHLDYRPLVNARAHQLGRRRQILNGRLHDQFHQLLKILSYRRELTSPDLMAVTYYMLLQDRMDEAIAFFQRVNAEELATRLQHDYFASYLHLLREDVDAARQVVARHLEHPVDRWRTAFAVVEKRLDEIGGADVEVLDPENRDQTQARLAATEPSFEFQVEAKAVKLNYQNLGEVRVNYYLMDIELLFSRNPFVQQYSSQFSHIRPNLTQRIELPGDQAAFSFPLPEALHNANVLVEVIGAGQTRSQAYYSNSLALQVIDQYGQLQITTPHPGQPLAKVYVKVYAQLKNGSVKFYKDGYTDLRGRFDYASLNTNELDYVQKFSLLVMSNDRGAVVREAAPPKR